MLMQLQVAADIRDRVQAQVFFQCCVKLCGSVDVLVNKAEGNLPSIFYETSDVYIGRTHKGPGAQGY